jgi:hypothetical protein
MKVAAPFGPAHAVPVRDGPPLNRELGADLLLGLARLSSILVDRTSSDLLRAVLALPAVLCRGLDVLVLSLSLLVPLLRHPCLFDCLRPALQGHDQVAYGPTRVNARAFNAETVTIAPPLVRVMCPAFSGQPLDG